MSKLFSRHENVLLYFFLLLFSLFAIYYSNTFIITNSLYHNSLSELLEADRIDQMFEMQHKSIWMSYVFVPIFLLIKITLVFTCIYINLFLKNITIDYKRLITVLLTAEFIFILQGLYKIVFFEYIHKPEGIEDLKTVMQFSLLDLVGSVNISEYLHYPLQLMNLFEVAYVLAVSYLLSKEIQQPLQTGLKYVTVAYATGLLLWCVTVIFIQIILG